LTESTLWAVGLSWWRIQLKAKIQAFFYAQLHVTTSIFLHKLGWLALWNELKLNNTPDIKKSDEQCFHLWFWHAHSLWTTYATQKHLTLL
jgi:hypothetical protein